MFDLTESDTAEGVRVLRMRDGENRINLPFVKGLSGVLDDAADAGGPLVLIGQGKFFCNGLDIDAFAASATDASAAMATFHEILARLLAFPGPVAAAVNGHAFGAGAILAAAADFRVMRHDRGYFCFPEVDMGLPMSDEFDAVLKCKLPARSVLRALLTGARYGGSEAQALGFVDDVATEDGLVGAASDLVRDLVGKDPGAVRALKAKQHEPALKVLGV